MNTLHLQVLGMDCSSCEERIQTTLSRAGGVLRSSADHRTGAVRVVFDPAATSEEAVRTSIGKAGFEVSS